MLVKNKKAFTLVELLITIVILAILTIIWFLSYQLYASDARDSLRVTHLRDISKWLALSHEIRQVYPVPDNYLDVIWLLKQWFVWETVSTIIKWTWFNDPKDDTNYIYSIDYSWKNIQLLAFLENNNSEILSQNYLIEKTYAILEDYTERVTYFVWDEVCVLLDYDSKIPINYLITWSLDLNTDSWNYLAVCSNDNLPISGSGENLLASVIEAQNSCVLWNTTIANWQSETAYNDTCWAITRTCNNWFLSWDNTYISDICTVPCSATTYNDYIIPIIPYTEQRVITKAITSWLSSITATCINWSLSYGEESIECDSNYIWNWTSCIINVQVWICWPIPANSIRNTATTITQTWYWVWSPTTTAVYNETPSPSDCRFICAPNYTWYWSICVADTQTYTCAAKPATWTVWNTVTSYTQTWNGSAWSPANTSTVYNNTTASTTSCNYKCATNYTWNWTSCVANTQTYTCAAKPATWTAWNTVASYIQTWNGSAWSPANTSTVYNNTTASTTSCRYTCATGFHTVDWWVSCVSNTLYWCYIAYWTWMQTWNGTARWICEVYSCNAGYTPQ